MLSAKSALLLWMVVATQAATYYDKLKLPATLKRAVDTYNYPLPIITFQDNPKKTHVETVKSVSPSATPGRYLPPSPTAASNSGQKSPPISVSFNAYEAPAVSADSKPAATSAPTAPPPVTTAPASATNTAQRKRPSGGLGGFKYYGGSGSSSSSSNTALDNDAAGPGVVSTTAPVNTAPIAPVKVEPAPERNVQKTITKSGYDYPSPKSSRKPSKKEQKLADSKPEESAQGYHYDVGPGALAAGVNVQTFSAGSSSGGMMGLSYMRQSSPYYSYHVMLD